MTRKLSDTLGKSSRYDTRRKFGQHQRSVRAVPGDSRVHTKLLERSKLPMVHSWKHETAVWLPRWKCTENFPVKTCRHNQSSLARRMSSFCQLWRLSVTVAKLDVRDIAWRINLVCRSEAAADHSLELSSESLVQQRIHKGVDRWIKQNHYESDRVSDVTRSVGGAVIG